VVTVDEFEMIATVLMNDTGAEETFDFPKIFEITESDEERDDESSSSDDEGE
jgi:hypothetical protein